MARVYPEKVSATMVRIQDKEEILFIRHSTRIQFGSSSQCLGSVIMTNPGKFEFTKTTGWEAFKQGKTIHDVFQSQDNPDLTMQNLIKVIRLGFDKAGLGSPNGILHIYNISNVRQPDGEKAENCHERTLKILKSRNSHPINILEDPVANVQEEFLKVCKESPFIILGFVNGVFKDKVQNIIHWSESVGKGIVYAKDDKGRYSHPRRWRSEPVLTERAVQQLRKVLLGEG